MLPLHYRQAVSSFRYFHQVGQEVGVRGGEGRLCSCSPGVIWPRVGSGARKAIRMEGLEVSGHTKGKGAVFLHLLSLPVQPYFLLSCLIPPGNLP